MKRGFTLIELLVVVLIIAILAAIALPRYRFAVAKARMAELIMVAKRFHTSQQEYFLVNGRYADDLSLLTIDGITGSGSSVKVGKVSASIASSYYNRTYWLKIFRSDISSDSLPMLEVYEVLPFQCLTGGSEANAAVCKLYGGRTRPDNKNYYFIDNF